MSRKRKRRLRSVPPECSEDGTLHFRLCHFCFNLNESSKEITQCQKCHRFLTFDLLAAEAIIEDLEEPGDEKSTQEQSVEWDEFTDTKPPGLFGLTVIW